MANFIELDDRLFENHPITKQKDVIKLSRKYARGIPRLGIFSDISLCYLYFRYASYFIPHTAHLILFFRYYFAYSKLFHQSGFFQCRHRFMEEGQCKYGTQHFGYYLQHLEIHNPLKSKYRILLDYPEGGDKIEFFNEDWKLRNCLKIS